MKAYTFEIWMENGETHTFLYRAFSYAEAKAEAREDVPNGVRYVLISEDEDESFEELAQRSRQEYREGGGTW